MYASTSVPAFACLAICNDTDNGNGFGFLYSRSKSTATEALSTLRR